MKRSYNVIAGMYDTLASIFIGSALRKVQVYCLPYIPAGAHILIAGGGTGWILEEITKLHHQGLQIDYLDISVGMIAKAKRRNVEQNSIRFIHQSAEDDFNGDNYDVIITPFFFDNFKERTMRNIFIKLHCKLKINGLWIYADFQVIDNGKLFQKSMLFIMYTFFRVVCNIEAKELPDVVSQFRIYNYTLLNSKTFKQGFIVGEVYRKTK